MTTTGLLLAVALCAPLRGQDSAVSTATAAVEASTAAVSAPEAPSVPEAPAIPKSRVIVHKEAAGWEPFSVRLRPAAGGRSSFAGKLRKVGGRFEGGSSPAKAAARVYPAGEDRWLVVCVYPASLRPNRMHLEARFLVQEGYLEEVQVAAVKIVGGRWSPDDDKEDSFSLRAKGVDFNERTPGGGQVILTAIDPGPGRAANAGAVRHAAFGGRDLGFVDFAWSLTSVMGEKAASGAKKRAGGR
ncbi:MAG: hypothetical protein PHU21_01605 [Elusimicrobia bacterium]|nr:hypothetical protein [Elusimicrobiota bacterium]